MNNKENSKDRREEIEFRALESNGKALLDREVIETFLSAVHDREEARIIARKLIDIVLPKVNDKGIISYLSYNGV
nr:hypothetical protein [Wolbachia endosymbiont of Ceratitis capitata]